MFPGGRSGDSGVAAARRCVGRRLHGVGCAGRASGRPLFGLERRQRADTQRGVEAGAAAVPQLPRRPRRRSRRQRRGRRSRRRRRHAGVHARVRTAARACSRRAASAGTLLLSRRSRRKRKRNRSRSRRRGTGRCGPGEQRRRVHLAVLLEVHGRHIAEEAVRDEGAHRHILVAPAAAGPGPRPPTSGTARSAVRGAPANGRAGGGGRRGGGDPCL
mmetsp:Transcript_16935/g.59165  ORF Transcript_16935/g.59165 Transcript_16935/m.59165 type:complete len:216 (+) Transcript_16935:1804-2451(+)